jgi:hypothetical protein
MLKGAAKLQVCTHLLADSPSHTYTHTHIHTPVMPHAQVSENNWKMIDNALNGCLILGTPLPNSRGPRPTLLYTAAPPTPASAL